MSLADVVSASFEGRAPTGANVKIIALVNCTDANTMRCRRVADTQRSLIYTHRVSDRDV